jgi:tetratricopeptide (TPR) repeat protein
MKQSSPNSVKATTLVPENLDVKNKMFSGEMKFRSIQESKMKKDSRREMMAILLVAFALLSLYSSVGLAATPDDSIISEGNRHYMNREFDLAARCYTNVIVRGFESAELYYNLGNANYKQNKLAEAILYYEKALLIEPGDEDIRLNLALANARIIDKIDSIPDFFLKRWVGYFQGLLSPNHWGVLSLLLFILALTGFTVFLISNRFSIRKGSFTTGIILLIASMTGLILMFSRIQKIQQHHNAIIMVPSVNARSSPDEQSTNVFVLHEGTKVMLMDSVKNWNEIGIADGNKGWVPGKVLGKI